MAKKVSDSQIAGIKAHAEAKNKETIDKVNKAIDKLKRKNKPINFETVCKEAGVSRATLYNNVQLKERILSLRAISKASPLDDVVAVKKDKIQLKDDKIASLREQVKKLEDDKKQLIVQLVDYDYIQQQADELSAEISKLMKKDADLSEKHLNELIKLGVFISMTCQELLDEE